MTCGSCTTKYYVTVPAAGIPESWKKPKYRVPTGAQNMFEELRDVTWNWARCEEIRFGLVEILETLEHVRFDEHEERDTQTGLEFSRNGGK